MESVGRLAGGVAHDFNNMLNVIMGYTEMLMDEADPASREDLQEILTAARRSAEITRQLLAFARKQTIAPKVLDLNDTVGNLLKMLGRLIGEDIDLAWLPKADLHPVKIDPTQVDQILANLCVNSRDAIEGVGKITIETNNVFFNEEYCQDHAGFKPGAYVMLAVSDDGSGMDRELQENIFEPFFTTKGVGKGTGLGLATVYGIVKQNEGFINVYSEPGKGTTIKIYLPRFAGDTKDTETAATAEVPPGKGETILLVEDEAVILKLGKRMLEQLGYRVLAANSPEIALELANNHSGKIDLLITDVVMPGMNGRDLALQLQSIQSELRVLFMSGYTANVIAHHGVLDDGIRFMQKPFSQHTLAVSVREALVR
jgi:two-component system sensor histidine kinase EvgS